MIEGYTPSSVENVTEYSLTFYTEPGWGMSFPCDETGKVDLDSLLPAARRNYEFAMANPQHYKYAWNKVERRVYSHRNPTSGICYCGNRISLTDQYLAACECPHCGQWWNLFGQALKPPAQWEEALEYD